MKKTRKKLSNRLAFRKPRSQSSRRNLLSQLAHVMTLSNRWLRQLKLALRVNVSVRVRLEMSGLLWIFAVDDASVGRQARRSGLKRIYHCTTLNLSVRKTSAAHLTGSLTRNTLTNALALMATRFLHSSNSSRASKWSTPKTGLALRSMNGSPICPSSRTILLKMQLLRKISEHSHL